MYNVILIALVGDGDVIVKLTVDIDNVNYNCIKYHFLNTYPEVIRTTLGCSFKYRF